MIGDKPREATDDDPWQELRLYLSLRAQQWRDALDEGEDDVGFSLARDLEDAQMYALAIVERVQSVGAVRAACEDVADALGSLDYDDAALATSATVEQWEAVANAIDPTNRRTFEVRLAAEQLRRELEQGTFDIEILADLVAIAMLEAELTDAALVWSKACGDGVEADYLDEHGPGMHDAFEQLSSLKLDLRLRGELDLDDALIVKGHDPD